MDSHSSEVSSPRSSVSPSTAQAGSSLAEEDGSYESHFISAPTRTRPEIEPLLDSGPVHDLSEDAYTPSRRNEDTQVYHHEETKRLGYLVLLTLSIGGLQVAWSVELSSISPFLLSLGMSKSLLALVWIAGPLSGTLVQPYVGIKSDNCRMKWGRRRPYIVGGAIFTVLSLLILAWTPELVGGFLSIFSSERSPQATSTLSQIVAIGLVYVLDFAINVIQAAIRAHIVDCAPTHQQESANALAGVITSIGSMSGFLSGYVDLPKIFPFLGHSQFQVLCAIASIAMIATVAISCLSVPERNPHQYGLPSDTDSGVLAFFKSVFSSMRRLPPQIKKVCYVQVLAWIGMFPFLFYVTTYVGGLYAEPFLREDRDMTQDEINNVYEHGTRVGTFALFVFSIVTFAASIIIPLMVSPTYKAPEHLTITPMREASENQGSSRVHEGDHHEHLFNKTWSPVSKSSRMRVRRLAKMCSPERFQIRWLSLRRTWLLSHVIFGFLMLSTFFIGSTNAATAFVSAVGIPWAITNWAPFALIAAEISKRDAIRRGLRPAPSTREGQSLASGDDEDSVDQAGVVLGIHNVAISAPQVLATLVSSVIFKALQKPRGMPGDNSVAWTLRFGGLCALVAAWLTRYVGEGDEQPQDDQGRQ